MTVVIVVEDGAIVPGANSYNTLVEIREYAANRGAELPVDDEAVKSFMVQATDYTEAKRDRLAGNKVEKAQPLQWPRYNVTVDGFTVDSDEIPAELKSAHAQLVIELSADIEIMPTSTGSLITEEKVGSITTKYSANSSDVNVTMLSVEALLQPLYKTSSFGLTSVRI